MSFSPFEYLQHIVDETVYLGEQTQNLSKEEFFEKE